MKPVFKAIINLRFMANLLSSDFIEVEVKNLNVGLTDERVTVETALDFCELNFLQCY